MKYEKHPYIHILVLGLTLLALIGCAYTTSLGNQSLYNETEASVAQKITEGKTTKAEVKALFGSSLKVSFVSGGLEQWTYDFAASGLV